MHLLVAALLVGCTGEKGDDSGSETTTAGPDASTGGSDTTAGSSDGGETDSTSSSPTTSGGDGTSSSSTTGGEAERFGFACIDLQKGESVEGDPFVGTRKIVVHLAYQPCFVDYYTKVHPEMRLDSSQGAEVFAEWKSRLCAEEVAGRIDCEVEGFEQVIMQIDPASYSLAVTYLTPNADQLDGRTVLWGPAPLADEAACAEGLHPSVKVTGLADVTGQDENGETLWQVQSFGGDGGLVKSTGGGCLQVNVAPTGG